MKRAYLNLAMVVLVVALGVGIYYGHRKNATPPRPPLTSLKRSQINRIEIDHPNRKPVVLERSKGQWDLTQPVKVRADSYEVGGLLDLATTPVHRSLEPSQVKLADLGLRPPKYVIKLNDVTLHFGEVEPLRYLRYVETGKHIALIDDPSGAVTAKGYAVLVDKHLLPHGMTIEKIQLPDVTVKRSADGKGWQIDPATAHAANDAAQKLVDHWSSATAMWTTGVSAAEKPPKKPEYVMVTAKSGSTLRFLIAGYRPQLVLERQDIGIRYTVGKDQIDNLLHLATAAPAAPSSAGKTQGTAPAHRGHPAGKSG